MQKLQKMGLGVVAVVSMMVVLDVAQAKSNRDYEPLNPVKIVLEDDEKETVYPSVAGDFLVYSQRINYAYSVARVAKDHLSAAGREVKADFANESIRYGVALQDGGIGHVSNRMGPYSAWILQAGGDGYVAIGHVDAYKHGLMPNNLKASADGHIWCYDTSLEGTRRAAMSRDFEDGHQDIELIGQTWRMYHSESWRYHQDYLTIETGRKNSFEAPVLFVMNQDQQQLMMIPHAFDGAISADGKQIAFVREIDGNFDIWMQDVDGKNLKQITTNKFGDFEPAFSPDGKRLAFISNRDHQGEVRQTSIYVVDLSSGRIEQVTNAEKATDGGVAWLDEHHLIFHSNRNSKDPQKRIGSHWNLWQVEMK
ncbi:MAG: PD40 domain-containing protein [Zetaproteobacteria bacterium]|nr:PD40 domain-containing protein [Zetaproteobacteria bacterium]